MSCICHIRPECCKRKEAARINPSYLVSPINIQNLNPGEKIPFIGDFKFDAQGNAIGYYHEHGYIDLIKK